MTSSFNKECIQPLSRLLRRPPIHKTVHLVSNLFCRRIQTKVFDVAQRGNLIHFYGHNRCCKCGLIMLRDIQENGHFDRNSVDLFLTFVHSTLDTFLACV